jgi:ribosomal protein L11 methylase PrmA
MSAAVSPASFRDPAGFVYSREGELFRQVNRGYEADFVALEQSGLYQELTERDWLVRHQAANIELAATSDAYAVIQPQRVPFVSYPYEWCFGQLKDAALLTLDVQLAALLRGMTLRDASAFNVQFVGSRPVFIDTLSFGAYREGEPWVAYRQFCEHFLAPLALMAHRDIRLSLLHREFSDGVPLDLARTLLGTKAFRSLGLLLHVRMHAGAQRKHANASASQMPTRKMAKRALVNLIQHLRSTVQGLRWKPAGTEWADYERTHNYSADSIGEKERIVGAMVGRVSPRTTWDLGANTGIFSRIAADAGSGVLALDGDPGAVELGYHRLKAADDRRILPLVCDLSSPSPASGWALRERSSLVDRGPADCVLALALMHHLTLSAHVPLPRLAHFFSTIGKTAIVEYVPFTDVQSQRLIASRREETPAYTLQQFEASFTEHFRISERGPVGDSGRVIYRFDA